jgi:type II secretory ATPase GspE/PulE/Tfp pilus assembly ATPase PilB-like protein
MAFRAAMTGHQVFSTLHTNSAIRSIPRLFDLGIRPDVIAGNVIGIIAQRLVRKLCPACRRMEPPSAAERELLGIDESHLLGRPVGCPACDHQGYRGRTTLIEILAFDEEIDELVAERASLRRLGEYAKSRGFTPMASDGFRRVREGMTTLEEVARVVDLTRQGHAV